ncbi:MAG: ribokinase, partial [Anaerolineaceae bacterium]
MVADIIERLARRHVLVVGDIVLDEYLIGTASRISREAPVPVLEYSERRLIAGGAANPSVNIMRLGSQAHQVAVVGADDAGDQLRDVLSSHAIDTAAVVTDPARATTVKTRLMAQMGFRFPQQVARLDRVNREPIAPDISRLLADTALAKADRIDALLFSDYHAGLLTADLVKALVGGLRETHPDIILTADAQGELAKYAGLTLVKCNADDARAYLQRDLQSDDDFAEAARTLYTELRLTGGMVITRGADGATLATAESLSAPDLSVHVPAPSVTDVYDTVGAGDTA